MLAQEKQLVQARLAESLENCPPQDTRRLPQQHRLPLVGTEDTCEEKPRGRRYRSKANPAPIEKSLRDVSAITRISSHTAQLTTQRSTVDFEDLGPLHSTMGYPQHSTPHQLDTLSKTEESTGLLSSDHSEPPNPAPRTRHPASNGVKNHQTYIRRRIPSRYTTGGNPNVYSETPNRKRLGPLGKESTCDKDIDRTLSCSADQCVSYKKLISCLPIRRPSKSSRKPTMRKAVPPPPHTGSNYSLAANVGSWLATTCPDPSADSSISVPDYTYDTIQEVADTKEGPPLVTDTDDCDPLYTSFHGNPVSGLIAPDVVRSQEHSHDNQSVASSSCSSDSSCRSCVMCHATKALDYMTDDPYMTLGERPPCIGKEATPVPRRAVSQRPVPSVQTSPSGTERTRTTSRDRYSAILAEHGMPRNKKHSRRMKSQKSQPAAQSGGLAADLATLAVV